MRSVDYFEEVKGIFENKTDEEYKIYEKLKNAFVTPIEKEDIFELYLIALIAHKNKFTHTKKIIEKICFNRSLKGIDDEIKRFYMKNQNESERKLVRKICKIALKNT